MHLPPPDVASRLELDAAALTANLAVFRTVAAGARLGVVLKGNAYGHGFAEVLAVVHDAVDWIFVITPGEALAIRAWEAEAGRPRRDVLVIGAASPREAVLLAAADVAVVAADPDFSAHVAAVEAAGHTVRVHVHLDTGLSREGFLPEDVAEGVSAWAASSAVSVEGAMTHFADTEDVTEQSWALRQLERFDAGVAALEGALAAAGRPTRLLRHTAASAAALVLPGSRLDVVRVGMALYGVWPSRETRISARLVLGDVPELHPALAWRAPAQLVKWVPAGSLVGYGCTHRCEHRTRVAVLPVGYWDGYPRLVSGRAHVLVRGTRCRVLGRVMMNHVIVDVTDVPDDGAPVLATLLGTDGDQRVSADDLAGWAQTIAYEITTRLAAHLRRTVIPLPVPAVVG